MEIVETCDKQTDRTFMAFQLFLVHFKKISVFKLTDSLYLQMGFLKSSVQDSKVKFVQGNSG